MAELTPEQQALKQAIEADRKQLPRDFAKACGARDDAIERLQYAKSDVRSHSFEMLRILSRLKKVSRPGSKWQTLRDKHMTEQTRKMPFLPSLVTTLPPSCRLLYLLLHDRCNGVSGRPWVSTQTIIANDLGLTRKGVNEATKKLVEANVIRCSTYVGWDAHQGVHETAGTGHWQAPSDKKGGWTVYELVELDCTKEA